MRLEALRRAYKIAYEELSVDYGDKTPEEIKELDDALDTVFKLAKLRIEDAEHKIQELETEIKELEAGTEISDGKMTVNQYFEKRQELINKLSELKKEVIK